MNSQSIRIIVFLLHGFIPASVLAMRNDKQANTPELPYQALQNRAAQKTQSSQKMGKKSSSPAKQQQPKKARNKNISSRKTQNNEVAMQMSIEEYLMELGYMWFFCSWAHTFQPKAIKAAGTNVLIEFIISFQDATKSGRSMTLQSFVNANPKINVVIDDGYESPINIKLENLIAQILDHMQRKNLDTLQKGDLYHLVQTLPISEIERSLHSINYELNTLETNPALEKDDALFIKHERYSELASSLQAMLERKMEIERKATESNKLITVEEKDKEKHAPKSKDDSVHADVSSASQTSIARKSLIAKEKALKGKLKETERLKELERQEKLKQEEAKNSGRFNGLTFQEALKVKIQKEREDAEQRKKEREARHQKAEEDRQARKIEELRKQQQKAKNKNEKALKRQAKRLANAKVDTAKNNKGDKKGKTKSKNELATAPSPAVATIPLPPKNVKKDVLSQAVDGNKHRCGSETSPVITPSLEEELLADEELLAEVLEDEKTSMWIQEIRKNSVNGIERLAADSNSIKTINDYGSSGTTALNEAVIRGNSTIIQLLINAHADVNKLDRIGESALHTLLTFGGDPNSLKLLLDAKGDLHQKNRDGQTPLDMAQRLCSKNPNDRELKSIVETYNKINGTH